MNANQENTTSGNMSNPNQRSQHSGHGGSRIWLTTS
jgi:hypothetical protein